MTRKELKEVWNWIDDVFHETETAGRMGESVNVVQSDLDIIKSDLKDKLYKDFEPSIVQDIQGLDEAAEEYIRTVEDYSVIMYVLESSNQMEIFKSEIVRIFKAGAKWMAEQGEIVEGTLGYGPHLQKPIIMLESLPEFYDGHCQEVIVQIKRKI